MLDISSQETGVTDDFGNLIYSCRYTSALVPADSAVLVGAIMPKVKARYVIAPSEEAKAAHKANGIAFHESEANCNTCRFLRRIESEKNKGGFLFGRCESKDSKQEENSSKVRIHEGALMFHPDDPMHMPCYSSRWTE